MRDDLLDAARAYVRDLKGADLPGGVLLYDTDHGPVPIQLDAATPLALALDQAARVGCRQALLLLPGDRSGEVHVVDDRQRRSYHRFLDGAWTTFRPTVTTGDGIERVRVPEVQGA